MKSKPIRPLRPSASVGFTDRSQQGLVSSDSIKYLNSLKINLVLFVL